MAFEGEIIKRGTEFMGAWQSAKAGRKNNVDNF